MMEGESRIHILLMAEVESLVVAWDMRAQRQECVCESCVVCFSMRFMEVGVERGLGSRGRGRSASGFE